MLNITSQVLGQRRPVGFGLATPRMLAARIRRNQQPAASPAEAERGTAVLSTIEVTQALAETWGWS